MDSLEFLVFCLELALHFEFGLSFSLDTLLLHVSDNPCVHSLVVVVSNRYNTKARLSYCFLSGLCPVHEIHNTRCT